MRNDFRLLRAPIELGTRSALRDLSDMLTQSYGRGAIGYALALGVVAVGLIGMFAHWKAHQALRTA